MLRKIYRDSGRFIAQLREEWAPPKRVVQALPSEFELFAALSESHSTALRDAKSAYAAGDRDAAIKLLIAQIHSRERPEFFISSNQIAAAADDLRHSRPAWVANTLAHADRLTAGRIASYARETRLLSPEDWAAAPVGPGNDMLYRYRPHRFAFAPRLALAILYGHENALTTLERLIRDWAESIRPDAAFAGKYRSFTVSSHVALYRSIAVSWTMAFLAATDEDSVELELLCLRIVLGDARYIQSCMPNTTSNNHLLADGFGLWYLGSLYPEFSNAEKWRSAGLPVFRRELLRQVYPDGCSFEQSVHYQEHACEMAVGYLALCRRNAWPADDELEARTHAMLYFQATLSGVNGVSFPIGDATDDPLFPLDAEESSCGPALRSIYADLRGDLRAPTDLSLPVLERAFWLSGGRFPGQSADAGIRDAGFDVFADGGFAVMTAREGQDQLVMRTGPAPGTDLVAGHMHFDYLSIYLCIDGKAIIVPGGTYTYRATPPGWTWKYGNWRAYFMSACGANGLILSDPDPLQRTRGDFPGGVGSDIACRVRTKTGRKNQYLAWVSAEVVGTGEHAGWTRNVLQILDDYWLVLDEFPGHAGASPGWLGFQFPAGAQVGIEDDQTVSARVDGTRAHLAFSAGYGPARCLEGSTRPAGGWVSTAYGEISAAPQLRVPRLASTTIGACVLARAGISIPPVRIISINQSGTDLTLRIDRGEVEDHFEISLVREPAGNLAHWRRTQDGRTLFDESV